MSIELATKYSPKVDDLFAAESKSALVTNTDYDFDGAHTVKIYKISTAALNDYQRNFNGGNDETEQISRYGKLKDLGATTEYKALSNDKSFIFNIDKLDENETSGALAAETALAREIREVVIPTVDTAVFAAMSSGAGTTETSAIMTKSDIYDAILAGSEVLDDNEVPDTERCLIVSPAAYKLIKKDIKESANAVSEELRLNGVIGIMDGMNVIKVPSKRLPENTDFIIVHPSAVVAPVKLEDFGIHNDTPLSSGTIVTGRIVYDAFVLENKNKGVYVHKNTGVTA